MDESLMLAVETSSLRGSVALGRCGAPGCRPGSDSTAGAEIGRHPFVPSCLGASVPASSDTEVRRDGVGRDTPDSELRRCTGPPGGVAWRALSAERKNAAELLPAIHELLAEFGAQPADVGVVCFSQGPGSFTGLRVAATLARMWQSATGCRVVAVPTLEVVARSALALPDTPTRLAVIIDARHGQVYGAEFDRGAVISPLPSGERAGRGAEIPGVQPSPSPSLGGRGEEPSPDPSLRGRGNELRTVAGAGLHDAATWLGGLEKPCGVLGEGVAKHRSEVIHAGLEILPEETWWPDARQVLVVGRRLAAEGRFCLPAEILPAYLRPPECEEVYEQRRAEAQARRGV